MHDSRETQHKMNTCGMRRNQFSNPGAQDHAVLHLNEAQVQKSSQMREVRESFKMQARAVFVFPII